MASSALTTQTTAGTKPLTGGLRFDWLMSILGFLFVGGLFLDGWAHAHGKVDNTFFTPWHAVLYSGYAINALVLFFTLFRNHSQGVSWQRAIPQGYELSLIGVPFFAIGGIGDAIWHTLFGFEIGVEQLLSPTHLVLAFSGILIMTGPLRAAMRRSDMKAAQGWSKLLPMLLSLVALLLMFAFFTEFVNPFVRTWVVVSRFSFPNISETVGIAGILIQAGIFMGTLLLVVRRWRLPLGSLTFILTLNMALISVLADQYRLIPAVLIAGIIADILYQWLKPSIERQNELRIFAFLTPTILYLCYFAALGLSRPIVWSLDLWLGSCFMSGVVGLVLSFLVVPPLGPMEVE